MNKRPRGLDALLGHLLVKRIPVMYKFSSTKFPAYLNSKVDTIKVVKSWKSTELPQIDLEHLTVISTLQALKTFP